LSFSKNHIEKGVDCFLCVFLVGIFFAGCGGFEEQSLKFYKRGIQFFEKKEFKKAETDFRHSIEINPNFADAHFMLGMALAKQGLHSPALWHFSKCIEIAPENMEAKQKLAEAFYETKRFQSAYTTNETVLEREPENIHALLLKAKILIQEGKDDGRNQAEGILEGLIEGDIEVAEAYTLLAGIYKEKRELSRSRDVLVDFLENDPDHFLARFLLAEVYEELGELSRAEKEYLDLFSKYPGSDDLKDAIVQFYLEVQQIDSAQKFLENLVLNFPDSYKNRIRLIEFYDERGQKTLMVQALEATIRDFPQNFEPVRLKVAYLNETRQVESALAVLKDFAGRVPAGPMHLDALNLSAKILWQAGRVTEALATTEKVLEKNPGDFQANALKGDILLSQNDYSGAVVAYRIVLVEQPGDIPIYIKIGDAHRLGRQYLLAVEFYKNALGKDPSHPEARLGLAKAYILLGKPDNALKQLKILLDQYPENEEAKTLLKELR
jgi:tetratricopeptide (TPR) repeat protein